MGSFSVICPRDDAVSQQSSDWCAELVQRLTSKHQLIDDVDDNTPADTKNIVSALKGTVDLVCYFGHGDEHSWLTNQSATIDASNVQAASGKTVVSVACRTGCNLGADAITAGVQVWLAFTIDVPVIPAHKNQDPIGDAFVNGLELFGSGKSVQDVRDELERRFDALVTDYGKGGKYSQHPGSPLGYYGSMCLRDRIVVHGSANHSPL